jgi:molecular chaperone GrpE
MPRDNRFFARDRAFATWAEPRTPVVEIPTPQPHPVTPGPVSEIERLRSALADLEDTKHRVQRDAQKERERLSGEILMRLLPILDNLERSFAVEPETAQAASVIDGVRLVHAQLLATLAELGLERRSAVGQRFDPRAHDAIAVVPVSDPARDGIVVGETEPAYILGDRVIRPARVQVGRHGGLH